MNIRIGFSPCPNDTFIFYAMLHQRVDCEGITFQPYISDVEDLNRKAFGKELEATKLSFHAYCYLLDDYILLNSGAALGNRCGPLLISKRKLSPAGLGQADVLIPGRYTTAALLLRTFYPRIRHIREIVFSAIEGELLDEKADAGVIIHENRFTYEKKGLQKIADLGDLWESQTGHPIPLGGIVVRRDIDRVVQEKIDRVMKRSVEFAFAHTEEVMNYVRQYAQEMEEAVMLQHIGLYVNDFTVQLGTRGRDAVEQLLRFAVERQLIAPPSKPLFI